MAPETPDIDGPDIDGPDIDGQDIAEVYDEDNLVPDSDRMHGADDGLTFETMPDVYDATQAVGDEDDDDALIGEELDDEDIVELERDDTMDDEDLEDDDLLTRDGEHYRAQDDLIDDEDGVSALGEDEVELVDGGDLANLEHALPSAKRFESSRLSDEQIAALGYGHGERAVDTDQGKVFAPRGVEDRTPEQAEKHARQDELLDQGVEETFPASDPVSVKHIT